MKLTQCLTTWIIVAICELCAIQPARAQGGTGNKLADSLIIVLQNTKTDTGRITTMIGISRNLLSADPQLARNYADSAMQLSLQVNWQRGVALAYLYRARVYRTTSDYVAGLENAETSFRIFDSLQWKKGMGDSYSEIGNNYERLGNFSKAVENNFKAIGIYEELGITLNIGLMYNNIGNNYFNLNNYPKAIESYRKSLDIFKKIDNKFAVASALDNMATVYEAQGEPENVNSYNLQAIKLFEEIDDKPAMARIYNNRGNILAAQKNMDSALSYYKKAASIAEKLGIKSTLANSYYSTGDIYLNIAKKGSAAFIIPDSLKLASGELLQKAHNYYSKALDLSEQMGDLSLLKVCTKSLSEVEALSGNYKAALDFYTKSTTYNDSIYNDENKSKIASLENERIAEVKDKEIQLLNKENALQAVQSKWVYSMLGIIILAVLIIASIQYRNSKHKQQINDQLVEQKKKVESTLTELESTQKQLIQSAKIASLGELTAGIAHEIQNPLNFVNNFSEINKELISELVGEVDKGNTDEVKLIAADIKENSDKINYHGKRADSIVKGMLQHSRTGTGHKESTNINALADEYLRLSYHGIRAKDKSFNTILKTEFDERLGNINIIPQDIGRVLLNLYNNAFYAVSEKKKLNGDTYEPVVSVTTKKIDDKVSISVKDNGNGIPQKIVDKIFQPFFTTKPTGQGTGLGLSLAYDIVKAHGGEIKVNTNEDRPDDPVGRGEGSEFIIQLRIN